MSIVHWVAVLLVVMLVFGTKKLGSIGSDLGKAVKGFKDGVKAADELPTVADNAVILELKADTQAKASGIVH